jgi:hypothetical protein
VVYLAVALPGGVIWLTRPLPREEMAETAAQIASAREDTATRKAN